MAADNYRHELVDRVVESQSNSNLQLDEPRLLSNEELIGRLKALNARKQQIDAELLLYLSELDRRWLYREHACGSLFTFCVMRLGYSEDVAYKRVGAARMIRSYPFVYELLREGRIHLSALMLLKPNLTEHNHREWLLAACGRSKREVEALIAERCPRTAVPTSIRRLPERSVGDGTPGSGREQRAACPRRGSGSEQ